MSKAGKTPTTREIGDRSLDSTMQTESAQINVPPASKRSCWKVIVPAIRCPVCSSEKNVARTGKRINSMGFHEHYRECIDCGLRFRVIFE